jgi:hypothetical protein
MKPRTILLVLAILLSAALIAACAAAPEPPAEVYRGTIRSGCAPHDAPSTVIQLESVDGSLLVFFNLWPPSGTVPPSTIEFDADHPVAQGAYCTGPDACEPAEWGQVVLASAPGEGGVSGEWTLGMAGGQVHHGTFEAEWLTIQALCG